MAVKSPMEYFQEQDFSLPSVREGERREISPAERQFLRKYLGVDDPADLGDMPSLPRVEGESVLCVRTSEPLPGMTVSAALPESSAAVSEKGEEPAAVDENSGSGQTAVSGVLCDAENMTGAGGKNEAGETISGPIVPERREAVDVAEEESVDARLRTLETVTMVGFYVGKDVFVVPIDSVVEVIHYTALHRLPQAPSFLSGVVNLRGSILPVINMVELLTLQGSALPDENGLIIICEARDMKLGLLVSRLHTIHKAKQGKFNWNAELHLGSSAELLSGLLETEEKLLGILSVERLIAKLLEG